MTQRIPLRHYRLFTRAPYLDVAPESVTVRLPGYFRGTWSIPTTEIALVKPGHETDVKQDQDNFRVFVEPVRIPYLPTTTQNVGPNLELLFRTPQRLPAVRLVGSFNGSLPYRGSRSSEGAYLDGMALRVRDPLKAAEVLRAEGVEQTASPAWWLAENRETSRDESVMAEVTRATRTQRRGRIVAALGFPLALAGKLTYNEHSNSNWPLVLSAAGVLLVFGAPAVASRLAKRSKQANAR